MDLSRTHRNRGAAAVLALTLLCGCAAALRWDATDTDVHVVAAGDTLHSIAFRHQLQARTLAHWNGFEAHHPIHPGQALKLYPPIPGETRRPPPRGRAAVAPPRGGSRQVPVQPTTGRASSPPTTTPASAPPPAAPPPMPSAAPYRWLWPADGSVIARYAPAQGRKGISIGGRPGDPVRATAAGKVVYSGNALKGYGQLLIIKHDEDYLSAYGHNRRLLLGEGDWAKAGQQIAELGTGPQQKPLLHFEIRRGGKPLDPLSLLPDR